MNRASLLSASRDVVEHGAAAARLASDLPPFLRTPLTLAAARAQVRQRLQTREERFLLLAQHAIYAQQRSPYRQLLAHAGCELGDLRRLVSQDGLEGALNRLTAAGVYVTFDEFKGRRAAVRGSARFTFTDRDFDNPLPRTHLISYTSGSGGQPSRVIRGLGNLEEGSAIFTTVLDAHGIRAPRNAFWIGGSVVWPLLHLKLGHTVDIWFHPTRLPRLVRAAHQYVSFVAARGGRRLPLPVYCGLQEPEPVARWLAAHARADAPIVVNTRGSSAVRVAVAARSLGLALTGVTFHCRSELFSRARQRLIAESGAGAIPDYASVELAYIAYGCPNATAPDDLHLSSDRYAVTERPRPLFEGGPTVDALMMTTLSPYTPKLAFNTELGDSARVEMRDCGCALGSLGLRTHLSEIRSFEKLSSEGTSFSRTNVLHILEEVLPARFGGTALDYQLVEEEGENGATVLVLRVAPSVGPLDTATVRNALLEELGRGSMVEQLQADLIRRAASVSVQRLVPLATGAGKVLPLHLARTAGTRP